MATEQDYSIDVDYGPRDKYGVSLARYKEIEANADAESARQKSEFERLNRPGRDYGIKPVSDSGSALDRAEAEYKKEHGEKSTDGMVMKALKFVRGASPSMIGSVAGTTAGTALAGPAGALIGESLGSGGGEILSQALGWSEPSKLNIATAFAGGPLMRGLRPAFQAGRAMMVGTFGGRDVVAEAAENVLKNWMNPAVSAKALYASAEATRAMVPYGQTARTVENVLQNEINRMPLDTRRELLRTFAPVMRFVRPTQQAGRRGFQTIRTAPVADAMAEVRRLGLEARKAFKADKADVGNTINKIRASIIDDLEAAGVPEVRQASIAYRKEMALEELSEQIARPTPGQKIRDYARNNPLFKGAFSPAEMEQINRVAKKLTFVAPSGGAGIIGQLATTGLGLAEGGPAGGVVGYLAPHLIRNILATPYGRGVAERVLSQTIAPGPREIAILASIGRALGSQYFQQFGDKGDDFER